MSTVELPNAFKDSRCAEDNASLNATGDGGNEGKTVRMPFPPPPWIAFISTGKPIIIFEWLIAYGR